jgi:hypothetical protein
MRIIILNDSDGHTFGIPFTPENVAKVQQAAIARGIDAEDMQAEPDGLPVGRRYGGICEVIDTDKLQDFPRTNPFI